jgi:hypothetical protein
MRYVMDETCLDFNGCTNEEYINSLEYVLDVLDDAILAGYDCFYSSEMFLRLVYNEFSIWELFNPQSPIAISAEVRIRLAVIFSKLKSIQDFDDEDIYKSSFKFKETGVECCHSVAWACFIMLSGADEIAICITSNLSCNEGLLIMESDLGCVDLWFVASQKSSQNMFRWIICNFTSSPSEMENYASYAFTNLNFIEGAFNGIKGMSKPYANLLEPIVKHLSTLSDEGERIFSGRREDIEAEFGAYGVNLSDENGATKRNSRTKSERTAKFKNQDRHFWWHTKLEKHKDRIHFCPADLPSGGKIIIGIFCYHLS